MSGVGAAHMRTARDYILYKLHELPNDRRAGEVAWRESPAAFSRPHDAFKGEAQDHYAPVIATHYDGEPPPMARADADVARYLKRGDVARAMAEWHIRVETDDILDMLKGVAVMISGRGWVFRNKTDTEFVTRHPVIVERQKEALDRRYQQLCDHAATALQPRRPTLSHHPTCMRSRWGRVAGETVRNVVSFVVSIAADVDTAMRDKFKADGVLTFTALRLFCMNTTKGIALYWCLYTRATAAWIQDEKILCICAAEKNGIKAGELHGFLVREAKEVRLTWWGPCVDGTEKVYVLATDDEQRDVVLGMFCERQTIKRADALETCRTQTGKELSATYVYPSCHVTRQYQSIHSMWNPVGAGHGRA